MEKRWEDLDSEVIANAFKRAHSKTALNAGLCPVHIGVDLADGPDKMVYMCPVCHNEIRGNDKVCCGVWHE